MNIKNNIILIFLIALLSSCSLINSKSFNKKKYTSNKSRHIVNKDKAVVSEIENSKDYTADLSNGISQIISLSKAEKSLNIVSVRTELIGEKSFNDKTKEDVIIEKEPKKDSDFEELPKNLQNQAIIDFTSLATKSKKWFFHGILTGPGFAITAFISLMFCFKALKKVKGIDHKKQSKEFRRRYNGMRVLKYVGSVIYLSGFVILFLFLWYIIGYV